MKSRLFLVGMLAWACSVSAGEIESMQLRTFGQDNPALIYVFTSPSCPHCACFHDKIMPTLKTAFAQTGLAQIKVVDMPYDARALRATQLARCMNDDAYEHFMDAVYANQAIWGYGKNPDVILKEYATEVGMTEQDITICLDNNALKERIVEQRDNLADLYRVRGMPTTVVVKGVKSASFSGTDEKEILDGIKKVLETQ